MGFRVVQILAILIVLAGLRFVIAEYGTGYVQLFAAIGLLAGVSLVIGLGVREPASRGNQKRIARFLVIGAALIFVTDVPMIHASHCSTSPSGQAAILLGIWWLPYALYSLLAMVCIPFLHAKTDVRSVAGFLFNPIIAILGALLLEAASHDMTQLPWWVVHLTLQLVLLGMVVRGVSSHARLSSLTLPLMAMLMPFLPLSIWHASARIRVGDSTADLAAIFQGYWYWMETPEGGSCVWVFRPDLVIMNENDSVGFTPKAGGMHACWVNVHLTNGRATGYSLGVD